MKNKTLIVKKKNVYGNELIYPVCNDAILGYKFETQKEEI
jgi:hypothetical protein